MQLSWLSIILFSFLTSCEILTLEMRIRQIEGWRQVWPGARKDKRFAIGSCTTVYAWPSTGGRFELEDPSAFELDVLGITNHFTECSNSANFTEEDDFVQKLRLLGGTFYEHAYWIRYKDAKRDEIHTWLGWPEDEEHRGGVWMLTLRRSEMYQRKTARIKLARTMQERCQAIQMCGGVFYAFPTDEHRVPMVPMPSRSRAEDEECLPPRGELSETPTFCKLPIFDPITGKVIGDETS